MNTQPLEIEYKFLIEMPSLKELSLQPQFKEKKLMQMYLELPQGKNCRIRKTETDGKVYFHKTFKKDVSGITRIEIEEEITEAEFTKLSEFIRKGTAPIEKTRFTFSFEGYTCEVDVFPFWNTQAFLEIEVESESITPPIPDFIKIIKDVSKDKNYRNSALSKGIFDRTLT